MLLNNWLVIALSCPAAAAEDCVNAPDSRNCWRDGFNINTDYTDPENVPTGKLVEYDLTVAQQIITPDEYEKLGTVCNGNSDVEDRFVAIGDTVANRGSQRSNGV